MTEKILFVDDEVNILAGFKRQLRNYFAMETAQGPEKGLRLLKESGPFAVVVSDLRMPVMDGIEFLSRVRNLHPDAVRIMLTGHADLESAIEAVNQGSIFRFLTKPCHPDTLSKVLTLGIEQHRLITAERELQEKTLKGSIKALTELLALANPEAFGRTSRIKRLTTRVAAFLGITDLWRLETAAMLSQVGFVILPEETLGKLYRGEELEGEEKQIYDMHPVITSDLLKNIPRLEEVARIVTYQEKNLDGTGNPRDRVKGEEIPLGSRILKAVLDFDTLDAKGMAQDEIFGRMEKREGRYDPAVLHAMKMALGVETRYEILDVGIGGLSVGMILGQDVVSREEKLLISKGQEVSQPLVERLKNYAEVSGVREPIRVFVPAREEAEGVE
jgi:response regulator RpfG family c-di-GMP phosphodiesterase